MEVSGMLLMLLLGFRHGLDPDHIAIIDSLSVRYAQFRPNLAKWTGTLFAIGHGSVVTSIAVMISIYSHSWTLSEELWNILDWLPGILLILVGILNLRNLLSKNGYAPTGLRTILIPDKLRKSTHPFSIVLIGILFAMVFDTNTQAAAWAYTATSELSTLNAIILGLSFSAGMVITDTLDSRILYRLMTRTGTGYVVLNYRRIIGWFIVCISFVVGGYKILSHLFPAFELKEGVLALIGAGIFMLMIMFYVYVSIISQRSIKNPIYGNQGSNIN